MPLLLEDAVREAMRRDPRQPLALISPPGGGKSTAARLLMSQEEFAGYRQDDHLRRLDPVEEEETHLYLRHEARPLQDSAHALEVRLCRWGEDEFIEYLIARHPDACGGVIQRLREAEDVGLLGGVPELCVLIMDRMAQDEALTTVRATLGALLEELWPEDVTPRVAQRFSLASLVHAGTGLARRAVRWQARLRLPRALRRLLRHRLIRAMLAAEDFVASLVRGDASMVWEEWPPQELCVEASRWLDARPEVAAELEAALARLPEGYRPVAVSLLMYCDPGWRPPGEVPLYLHGLDVGEICWRGVRVVDDDWRGADFAGAVLQGAEFHNCNLNRIDFCGARLRRAHIEDVYLNRSDLSGADLTGAALHAVTLVGARLDEASLIGTRIQHCNLSGARFDGADLSGAVLRWVRLEGCDLRHLAMQRTRFFKCEMDAVLLEGIRGADLVFLACDLAGARLTDACLPAADLRHSNLSGAELAGVDLHGADLRHVKFSFASFHAGSTREGVSSDGVTPVWEHPPVYSQDHSLWGHLAPELVRKADLRGADLRGASLHACDFYLVDVRGARMDEWQVEYLRKCGAIFEDWEAQAGA